MPSAFVARPVQVRHLQLARAVVAAAAACAITFSSNHSAAYGLAVFCGFAVVTAALFAVAAWRPATPGRRWPAVTIAVVSLAAAVVAAVPAIGSTELFFGLVLVWSVASGVVELVAGFRDRASLRGRAAAAQSRAEARDAITVGVITVVFGLALLFVPGHYALRFYVAEAHQHFTLTGITIAVGIFGGYAAIAAVYLGIAALSPRRVEGVSRAIGAPLVAPSGGAATHEEPHGGAA